MGFSVPQGLRAHAIAMGGELVGTFLFLFFAFSGTHIANTQAHPAQTGPQDPNHAQLLYISLSFGFSLAVNAWVFFRISGGLFNPAVTLGFVLVAGMDYIRGALITVAQILGAIIAAGIVSVLFPGPLNASTSLSSGTSVAQGLFIEMFCTFQLVFTIFMLAAEKHKATFIAPVGIGLALFIAELAAVHYTGGSLNPARSFGPSAILQSFSPYHWIYWLGPVLGSLLASGLYKGLKYLEYDIANPGQDSDNAREDPPPDSESQHILRIETNNSDAKPISVASAEARLGKSKDGGHEEDQQRDSYEAGPSTEAVPTF